MDPVGHSCPIEKKIASELEADLVETLAIDQNDIIEMELLWDLIDMKLLDMRSSGALKNGSLVQVVENRVGNVSTSREEASPILEIKMNIKRLKHSIVDSFVATRRAKKKYGMSSNRNTIEELLLDAASKSVK